MQNHLRLAIWILFCAALSNCAFVASTKDATISLDARDYAVLAFVVHDLEQRGDCGYGYGASGILVNLRSVESRDYRWTPQLSIVETQKQAPSVESLLDVLRERNGREEIIPWRIAEMSEARVVDLMRLGGHDHDEAIKSARCYASFALPAFSPDGEWVLIHINVGPSPHGADAWYLLVLDQGSWRIASYKFAHFL